MKKLNSTVYLPCSEFVGDGECGENATHGHNHREYCEQHAIRYLPTPGDLVIRELLRINDACRELLELMDKLDKKEEGK